MIDLDGMTRRFLMGESKQAGTRAYLRALRDGLLNLRPASQSQAVLVESMKNQLKAVTKDYYSMQEKVSMLEEKLSVLEENRKEE
jgi:hypothetical protein